jgi:hypothetical protein
MASLAQDLSDRGIKLEDPFQEQQQQKRALEEQQKKKDPVEEEEEDEDEDYSFVEEEDCDLEDFASESESESKSESDSDSDSYSDSETESEREDFDVKEVIETEDYTDEDEEEQAMPRPKKSKSPKRRKVDPNSLASKLSSLSMAPVQAITGDLSCPVLSGRWEIFDFNTDRSKAFILMRMVIIDGVVKNDDFQLSFVNKKTFKIRMKWPQYMQQIMMMANLDVTTTNGITTEKFPAGHQVYTDMGKNAKQLKDEGGFIWSEGLFRFKNDMNMSTFEPQLFQIPASKGGGTILQIQFEEAIEEETAMPFGSPIVLRTAGGASKSGKRQSNRAATSTTSPTAAEAAAAAEGARVSAAAAAATEATESAAIVAAAEFFNDDRPFKKAKSNDAPPSSSQTLNMRRGLLEKAKGFIVDHRKQL